MLFTTPHTEEEEKAIHSYKKEHPYAPFSVPSKKEVEEAKAELQAIKTSIATSR